MNCYLCGFELNRSQGTHEGKPVCRNKRLCLIRWLVNQPFGVIMPVYEVAFKEHHEQTDIPTGRH